MNPIFYDFKRGVLRISVIVTLVIFTLAGVGVAYAILAFIATMPNPQQQVLHSYIDTSTGEFKLEVLLLNPDLKPIDGEISYKLGCYNATTLRQLQEDLQLGKITPEVYEEEFEKLLRIIDEDVVRSSSGRVVVVKNLREYISRDLIYKLYINVTTVYGTIVQAIRTGAGTLYFPLEVNNKTVYVLVSTPIPFAISSIRVTKDTITTASQETLIATPIPSAVVSVGVVGEVEMKSPGIVSTSLYALGFEKSLLITSLYSFKDVYFDVYIEKLNVTEIPKTLSINDIEKYFEHVGVVHSGIGVLELNMTLLERGLRPIQPSLYVLLVSRSENSTMYAITRTNISPLQGGVTKMIVSTQIVGSVGVSLFITFFPVIVLYLVYIYIAKPRAQGALEFVLARPITRFELYTTRYFAGVLVVLVATVLFYTALVLSVYFFTGVLLDLYQSILLYAGLSLALIAFYSLCYMLSAFTSGTRYIVVSVITYMVFSILWNLLVYLVVISLRGFGVGLAQELMRAQYTSYYFTPLGIYYFMQYYYTVYVTGESVLTIESIINPLFICISTITWITIPVVLGWLVFKKTSLSG
ncbi:MAG: ABC transporter permease [Desulfurococcaceae archaeon]|nr:ABC transporter permease [Desulfurococcaceae archaeon]